MNQLCAEALFRDDRVAQAKRLMLEALADHRNRITGVRGPDPQRADAYRDLVGQFEAMRGGSLYFPYLGSGIGNGALVELADGSVKYDMISGIGVHHLGHSVDSLAAARLDAALHDTVMQGNLQQDVLSVSVSRRLIDLARRQGAALTHCFLTTSGAMANENALKLAFQKRTPADRVLAFRHCFAGRTLALSQITDKPSFRAGLPTVLAVDYVPFHDPNDPAGSRRHTIETLREHLSRYPKRHAVMCLELVQGEGGFYVGDRDFFVALLDILREHGVAVWFDEVQTFGRTTEPFAFQTFGLDEYADLVTIGKLTQLCATLFRDEYKPQPGLISQTFTASTSALAACDVILRELTDGGYFGADGRIAHVHRRFIGYFDAIARRHPDRLCGPFGTGAMIAFQVFDGAADRTKSFLQALFQAGVIAFVAGDNPCRVRFLPPVGAIRDDDIDQVCRTLESTLAAFPAP